MARINFLPPWVETNLQPAFYDLESGTCLQQTARMYDKVNQLVRSVNDQNDTIADYIQQFIDLKDYCEVYFDNLDVQEEINNKLDEMATDGSLTALIGAYCDPKFVEQNQVIDELREDTEAQLSNMNTLIQAVQSGSPLVASSTAGMTDTDRVYVNTSDGNWYYYDGDSWEIGGAYQSSGIADNSINYMMIDSITSELAHGKVPTYTETDGFVKANGSIDANSSYTHTSDIELKAGQTIVLYARGTTSTAIISWHKEDSSYRRLVVPADSNAGYFYYTTDRDINVVLSSNKDSFGKVKILTEADLALLADYNASLMLPVPTIQSEMIGYANGTVYTSQSNFMRTDWIPLLKASSITFTSFQDMGPSITSSGIAFYDRNKAYISGVILEDTRSKVISIPDSAYYCRYSVRKNVGDVTAKYNNVIASLIASVGDINSRDVPEDYYDLSLFPNVCVIGDSFACGTFCEYNGGDLAEHMSMSYPAMLARKYGFELHNISHGGMSTRSFINGSLWDDLTDDEPRDLYLLALERNDVNYYNDDHSDYLGNITDITGHSLGNYPDTFYGNYATIIDTILAKNSNAKIIMLTITKDSNATRTAFNNAMIEIAEHYSIAYIQEDDDSYFNTSLFKENRPGGGHPGAVQYNGMANGINRLINNCLATNLAYFKYTNPVE